MFQPGKLFLLLSLCDAALIAQLYGTNLANGCAKGDKPMGGNSRKLIVMSACCCILCECAARPSPIRLGEAGGTAGRARQPHSPHRHRIGDGAEVLRPGTGADFRLQPRRSGAPVCARGGTGSEVADAALGDRPGARAQLQHAADARARGKGLEGDRESDRAWPRTRRRTSGPMSRRWSSVTRRIPTRTASSSALPTRTP